MENSENKTKTGLGSGFFKNIKVDESKSEVIEKRVLKKKKVVNDDDNDDDDFMTDIKNEQLILGQALSNSHCLKTFINKVNYEDFIIDSHKVIAFCIIKASDDGVQINDDVFDIYRYDYPEEEKATGGISYIVKLKKNYSDNLTEKSFMVFIDKLKSDSIKHRIQNKYIKELLKYSRNPSSKIEDLAKVLGELDKNIHESSKNTKIGFETMSTINKRHDDIIKERETAITKNSTGFGFLDEHITEPYARKQVSIAAGRPGMGKSAYVANSMIRMANKGIGSALFALEMNSISTVDRFNAIESDIQLKKLITRTGLTNEERDIERKVKKRREAKPIHICDEARLTLPEIRRRVKDLVEEHGVRVIFIDLFMKISKITSNSKANTSQQYTEALNEIQTMAKELDVHFCLVVQINRGVESKADKRPALSDLKDSGGFEEVADLVMLFFRESYYLTKSAEDVFDVDIMEIILAKQRNGNPGTVKAVFVGETTKIRKAKDEDIELYESIVRSLKPAEKTKRSNSKKKSW